MRVVELFLVQQLIFFHLHLTFLHFPQHVIQMLPTISSLWIPCAWIAHRQYLLPCPPHSKKMMTNGSNWTESSLGKCRLDYHLISKKRDGMKPFVTQIEFSDSWFLDQSLKISPSSLPLLLQLCTQQLNQESKRRKSL